MLRKHLALFLLFLPALAFAQTASEMDTLLRTSAVTTGVAARFVMGAAGMTRRDRELGTRKFYCFCTGESVR